VASDFHYQAPAGVADDPAVVADNVAVVANDSPGADGEVEEWDAKGLPDLYGNEVIDAMARFKLDDAGSLYEVHSPETELPRLPSPVS
jgi:hypothetical protein